jgi:hypothetical protein
MSCDPALPAFAGRYLYARFNSGVRLLGPHAAPPDSATSLAIASVSGFGEDGVGHLYVTSLRATPSRASMRLKLRAHDASGNRSAPVALTLLIKN